MVYLANTIFDFINKDLYVALERLSQHNKYKYSTWMYHCGYTIDCSKV